MYGERHLIPVTTAADGGATVYSPTVTGRVLAIGYIKTDFDNSSSMTATAEATGQAIWAESNVNSSAVRYPRVQVHSSDGTVKTYDGTRKVEEPVMVANDRVKIIVAAGGNVKSGTFYVVIG